MSMVGSTRAIGWRFLGQIPYQTALQLQSQILMRHQEHAATPDLLLLLEHPPTFTVGRRSHATAQSYGEAWAERARLEATGAAYFESPRGGLITFHGPGQLVGYPILNLKRHQMSLKRYVCSLEDMLKATLGMLGIQAQSTEDVGVWIDKDRKIASIGFHASRWLTSHGFALNVHVDLNWFSHIVPCGLQGKQATSIEKELLRPHAGLVSSSGPVHRPAQTHADFAHVVPLLLREFGKSFDATMVPLAQFDAELDALCTASANNDSLFTNS